MTKVKSKLMGKMCSKLKWSNPGELGVPTVMKFATHNLFTSGTNGVDMSYSNKKEKHHIQWFWGHPRPVQVNRKINWYDN